MKRYTAWIALLSLASSFYPQTSSAENCRKDYERRIEKMEKTSYIVDGSIMVVGTVLGSLTISLGAGTGIFAGSALLLYRDGLRIQKMSRVLVLLGGTARYKMQFFGDYKIKKRKDYDPIMDETVTQKEKLEEDLSYNRVIERVLDEVRPGADPALPEAELQARVEKIIGDASESRELCSGKRPYTYQQLIALIRQRLSIHKFW